MPVTGVYQAYLKKVERKGGSEADLIKVICWLTGFDTKTLKKHVKEEIQDPLMLKIRYMDKLVDELAKGRPMEKILKSG